MSFKNLAKQISACPKIASYPVIAIPLQREKQSHDNKEIASLSRRNGVARNDSKGRIKVFFGRTQISLSYNNSQYSNRCFLSYFG